jgi:hypothetical protein
MRARPTEAQVKLADPAPKICSILLTPRGRDQGFMHCPSRLSSCASPQDLPRLYLQPHRLAHKPLKQQD